MKTWKITVRVLERLGACNAGIYDFERWFPRGVTLTDNQMTNFERLEGFCSKGWRGMWLIDVATETRGMESFDSWFYEVKRERPGHYTILADHFDWKDSDFALAGVLAEMVAHMKRPL